MKVRKGFVSNSSSSSFVVYGCRIETYSKEFEAIMNKHLTEEEKETVNEGDEPLSEFLYGKTKLEMEYDWDNECIYFGKSWSKIEDEQTGKEFKQSVKESLKELVGDDFEIETRSIDTIIYN